MLSSSRSWAESQSFAEEDAGRVDFEAEDVVRFEDADEGPVEDFGDVVPGFVVQSNVWQHQRHLLGSGDSKVEYGEGVASGREDRTGPELYVTLLKQDKHTVILFLLHFIFY